MLGMHGSFEANNAMHDCDLMICVGARFDDRITGRLDAFSPHSKKIHIDIDPSSINKNVKVDLGIVGDCAHVLEDMVRLWRTGALRGRRAGARQMVGADRQWRARNSFAFRHVRARSIKPQHAVRRLYELTKGRDVYITTEVGQHQMWAAQHFHFEEPNRWMTSGGLGTMGYGLPAAIGVQMAHPDALVIDIAGEASILMNMQEMSTAAAVPPAGEDLHPQQPIYGHGAPMAGIAARRALFGELHGIAARFRQARGSLWRARHPLLAIPPISTRRSCEMIDTPRRGDFRLPRRPEGELLPDDPLGQGA